MLHIENEKIRKLMTGGTFGLEKESLRVTGDGHFAHTKDPFTGRKNIVRDFCENQTEINTRPWGSAGEAVAELQEDTEWIWDQLQSLPEPEYLWPFSNPPYIRGEDDIPLAIYTGAQSEKTEYRRYLEKKYGSYLMTFSGIHLNYNFNEEMLRENARLDGAEDFHTYKDQVYLKLAEQLLRYGWIMTAVTAASPLLDGSFEDPGKAGEDLFTGHASERCGEKGYWNEFIPVMDYSSTDAYVDSISAYVESGQLWGPSELYFPIRLKAGGQYTLEHLRTGWTHIELRMIDLNPLEPAGINIRDVKFAQLLLFWLASTEHRPLTEEEKKEAVSRFKKASHYDLSREKIFSEDGREVTLQQEGIRVLQEMQAFYKELACPDQDVLEFEYRKFAEPETRYAAQILKKFSGGYVEKGLQYVKEKVKQRTGRKTE